MQIVVLILCIAAVLMWCAQAFARRKGGYQVLVFAMDVVVTFIILAAVIIGVLGYH